MAAAGAVKGAGLIRGYLKGFGYTEYIYRNIAGLAWSLPSVSGGIMTGKYVGQGMPSPKNFIGYGKVDFGGIGLFQLGKWVSYHDETGEEETWNGEMTGINISIPVNIEELKGIIKSIFTVTGELSGGKIETDTQIIFPPILEK
jgi:hypothetical protein